MAEIITVEGDQFYTFSCELNCFDNERFVERVGELEEQLMKICDLIPLIDWSAVSKLVVLDGLPILITTFILQFDCSDTARIKAPIDELVISKTLRRAGIPCESVEQINTFQHFQNLIEKLDNAKLFFKWLAISLEDMGETYGN